MADRSARGLGSDKMDPQKKRKIQSKGGRASSTRQDMSALGRKGGQAAQRSGNAHRLTSDERSRGGQKGSTSFTNSSSDDFKNIESGNAIQRGSRAM